MKKRLVLLCLYAFGFAGAYAQSLVYQQPKLSASTQQYLWKLNHQHNNNDKPLEGYVYNLGQQNKVFLSTMIQVQPGFSESALTAIDAHVGTKAGNIWTVRVPLDKVKDFILINGIRYIEIDQPASPTLDAARKATRIDSVQRGMGLPQPYSGNGVVVGIIDAGFDYTHPTLWDTSYSVYRVKRVWEEKNNTGAHPSNFNYGSEYTDSASILNKAYDRPDFIHATHVAGIAAGSGVGTPTYTSVKNKVQRCRGMAYASDIVIVGIYPSPAYWLSTGMADMLDGMNYIYQYAASVGKPAVANLSWGCPLGPHDGRSLFSQACNNLTGAGKIFCISAGNNGQDTIHLQKTFSNADTVVKTFSTFSTILPYQQNWIDVWGDSSKTFCIQFSLYNDTARIKTDSSATFCLDNNTHQLYLIGTNKDTCFVTLTSVSSEFNNKPHMLIQLSSRVKDNLCVTLKGTDGTINMWQGYVTNAEGYSGGFVTKGYSWATAGDSKMVVSDMVTSASAIGVAAYCSKPGFTNVSHQTLSYTGAVVNAIAPFSSPGPTADGRTKPNIAGPGFALASSVSSYDTTYQAGGANYSSVVYNYTSPKNGRIYPYAMAAGTSMSSPAVAGIVALLLEADPSLTPQQIMAVFAQTAIKDSYTGTIPANGSNLWGFGKVNAYAAIKSVLKTSGIYHQENNSLNCLLYPNPGKDQYAIDYNSEQNEDIQLSVFDATGRKIVDEKWNITAGSNKHSFNLSAYPAGIYLCQLHGTHGNATVKIVKQ